MIKFYLAGPMSGYHELNFPLFNSEAARLRALGYDVINPAEIDPTNPVFATPAEHLAHWRRCMRADIAALVTCDGIALLQGWERSKGASLEHHVATELGMIVTMADEITEQAPARSVAELATDWAAA